MGRAGNIFSLFQGIPPRYVPGTDFSGNPVEISLEAQFGSKLYKQHLQKNSAPIVRVDDKEDTALDSSRTSSLLECCRQFLG